jgi:hypothetical protein
MDQQELRNRFVYHPPVDQRRVAMHEHIRQMCYALAAELNHVLPEGREKSVAITNLEQVTFWANAAIARQPQDQELGEGDQ